MDTPLPAMRGHYSIRNPAANASLRALDATLRLLVRARPVSGPVAAPRRILISNIAHLGDVIVATSVLPALHAAYPQAEFGFLIGSWSLPVLEGHPLVTRRHVFDHWMQSRASAPRREKWRVHRRTRAPALREIRAVGYDLAIDLYWNMPNTLPLLWQARIPVRVGYGSAGFGPLATHCLELSEARDHVLERHRVLLGLLLVDAHCLSLMRPTLPPASSQTLADVTARLREMGVNQENYVVFHPGASARFKEWPEQKWRALALGLTGAGCDIVFTGHGASEEAMIQRIIRGVPGCASLCGRISWQGVVGVIQQARLLACVDTVAGHIAGAVGTPSAVLTAGPSPYLWKPTGAPSRVLMAPVPCAPCHRNYGCTGMECLRDLDVEQALDACSRLIRPPSAAGEAAR